MSERDDFEKWREGRNNPLDLSPAESFAAYQEGLCRGRADEREQTQMLRDFAQRVVDSEDWAGSICLGCGQLRGQMSGFRKEARSILCRMNAAAIGKEDGG